MDFLKKANCKQQNKKRPYKNCFSEDNDMFDFHGCYFSGRYKQEVRLKNLKLYDSN